MTKRDRLETVFREVFALPDTVSLDGLKYREIAAWDSVGHMQLIAAIETEFDIMLETDEILEMSSFSRALEIVGRHDASPAA